MRGESRNWAAKFAAALFVVVMACGAMYGQDIITNYLPGTDFSKYHTYKWVTVGLNGDPDEILDAQIKRSIDSQLVAKGLT